MRRLFALAAAAGLAAGATTFAPSAAAAATLTDHSVTVTVDDVSPSTPTPSTGDHPHRLTVGLSLTNTTSDDLHDVTITAERAAPIYTESALDTAIAHPGTSEPSQAAAVRTDPLKVGTLAAGAPTQRTYSTTTSTTTTTGICFCNGDAIYPLLFTVTASDAGQPVTVGIAQTYIPAFGATAHPSPLQVSWVWPLLDRPHRLSNSRTFLDDYLAKEVAAGGRLDRALQVVEAVADQVPLTLVIDPDLLDELEVMASGNYRVKDTDAPGGYVHGSGQAVAGAWLTRFTDTIENSDAEITLTPFADPDVDSLTQNGLSWTPALGDQGSQNRLAAALGGRTAERTLAWPVGGTLSQPTLTALVQQGVSTVVVDDRTLRRNRDDPATNALSSVSTSAGTALAAVSSTQLKDEVWDVLQPSGAGLGALPELVAHLALRVTTDVTTSHFVVLTPPRQYLDVDPAIAERAILATARTFWSQPLTLGQARSSVRPSDHGVLHDNGTIPQLPAATVAAIGSTRSILRGLTGDHGLLDRSSRSAATSTTVVSVDKLPVGLQRAASSAWVGRQGGESVRQAEFLNGIVDRVRAAVHIVPPAGSASYTLTSSDAPLPVTVDNPLDTDVRVQVRARAADGQPGFRQETVDLVVPAGDTQQIRIPTHIDRAGRIDVQVSLSTENHLGVGGDAVRLSVRNTQIGTVGVAITSIAAAILGLALLFRVFRALRWRVRQRRSGTSSPPPPQTDPLAS